MPFAGNTHDLQNRRTDDGTWFLDTVRKVNLRGEQGGTTQGFYVVDADGNAYGFNNNRSVERVIDFAASCLAKYKSAVHSNSIKITPNIDSIPDPPAGAMVLRVYQRIIPVQPNSHPSNANIQLDYFWILKEEVAALKDALVPESLQFRLLRFAFNDAIRGEPDMWRVEEIKKREFRAIKTDHGVRLTGKFAMQTADGARGLEGSFEAEITIENNSLTQFKAVADTTAWGRSTYTPDPPEGKFPLKFAIVIPLKDAVQVAPQAAFYGNEYLTGR